MPDLAGLCSSNGPPRKRLCSELLDYSSVSSDHETSSGEEEDGEGEDEIADYDSEVFLSVV